METKENSPIPGDGLELSRWLDGELDSRKSEALERRMREDVALRREAEVLSELEGLLKQRPASGEAPDVRGAVLARIERDLQEDVGWRILPRRWRMPVWAATWAVCGILLGFGVLGAVELQPVTDRPSTTVVASADDEMSFTEMFGDAIDAPADTVSSMGAWLEAPQGDSAQ